MDNQRVKIKAEVIESGIITTNISEVYGLETTDLNNFNLKARKSFNKPAPEISLLFKKIIDACSFELQDGYIELRSEIESNDYLKISEFDKLLFDLCITQELRDYVEKTIEDSYTVRLDEKSKETNLVLNEEMQFTDEHAKIILKASMTFKFIIPIICEFFNRRKVNGNVNERKENQYMFDLFTKILSQFTTEGININNKLNKLVGSRINKTIKKDSVMWKYYHKRGITAESIKNKYYKELILNIIPKLEDNSNVVTYLHSVINNKLLYLFKYNHTINYSSKNLNKEKSEGLTEFDVMEVNMSKTNEALLLINKFSIDNLIDNLTKAFEIEFDKYELDYYYRSIELNSLQKNLVALYYSRFLSSYDSINTASRLQYVKLLLILKKFLMKYNFVVLPKIINAKVINLKEKKSFGRSKYLDSMDTMEKYENIIYEKFVTVANLLNNKKTMHNLINNIKANSFHEKLTYEKMDELLKEYHPEGYKYFADRENYVLDDGTNIFLDIHTEESVESTMESIAEEIMNFISII